MNAGTQGLLVGLTGAICLRLALTGEYLRYVNSWMRWPLLLSAFILLALGLRLVWARTARGPAHGPPSTWLMALPILTVFVISPPPLGAYAAQRSAIGVATDRDYRPLAEDTVVAMTVSEFQERAQWDDTLEGFHVALTGFVTYDASGNWYVTSIAIACCAADAVAYRARVQGADLEAPPENSWVRVTGRWRKPPGTRIPRQATPVLDAVEAVAVTAPESPYE